MIDFLLSNIVFVVVIVFGLFRLLTSGNKTKQEDARKQAREVQREPVASAKPTETKQTNSSDIFGELKDLFKEITDEPAAKPESKPATKQVIKEEKQRSRKTRAESMRSAEAAEVSASAKHEEQLEKLRAQYTTAVDDTKYKDVSLKGIQRKKPSEGKYNEGVEDTDVKKLLNQRDLQESVVMAEILGPPRAYRSHQAGFRKRNI